MPMILLTVPPKAHPSECDQVDDRLQAALRRAGVEGGITVWCVPLATRKDRLLLEYKSRQPVADPGHLAQVMAEVVERIFGRQVEAAVIKLDPVTTGLHITPEK